MSEDVRNSLNLWAGGIAFGAILWIVVRFDSLTGPVGQVPSGLLLLVTSALGVWNLGQGGWGLWQRRASNPDNPNRR
jgi:uncharacterized membrane protein